jgi:hypothetical protein
MQIGFQLIQLIFTIHFHGRQNLNTNKARKFYIRTSVPTVIVILFQLKSKQLAISAYHWSALLQCQLTLCPFVVFWRATELLFCIKILFFIFHNEDTAEYRAKACNSCFRVSVLVISPYGQMTLTKLFSILAHNFFHLKNILPKSDSSDAEGLLHAEQYCLATLL